MPEADAPDAEVYVYAVVPSAELPGLPESGIFDRPVEVVRVNGVSAIVSPVPGTRRIRPERRHLAAHQAVLNAVLRQAKAVLPVAFGTIAESADELRALFSRHGTELLEQAEHVRGRVEMEIRALWNVPNVFERFVTRHPELRAARDRLFGGGRTPSRDEKIELGQLFERLLNGERDALAAGLEERVGRTCAESRRKPPRSEEEVAGFSCLIPKEDANAFESALADALKGFGDDLKITYAGPFPPYNFVDVHIQAS